MLKTVLYVSGKPGLYKLISQGKNMLIVESITADKKRFPVYSHDKITPLADIAIYTDKEEVPLRTILNSIFEKENGEPIATGQQKETPDQLRDYLAEVLPDFDRDRVYPTDIKKLLNWYNILITNGMTDFSEEEEQKEGEQKEEAEANEDPKGKTEKQ